MKGICHKWSRGRHFSPSMPGNRYLKLGSKSDHRAEISGNIVRYDALAPRPEVLRSISCLYANLELRIYFCFHLLFVLFNSLPFKESQILQHNTLLLESISRNKATKNGSLISPLFKTYFFLSLTLF